MTDGVIGQSVQPQGGSHPSRQNDNGDDASRTPNCVAFVPWLNAFSGHILAT
jgi:hypothetical protein